MKKSLLITLLVASYFSVSAQNETMNWYFGLNAGMNFSTAIPYALQGSALNTTEGTTVSSDSAGNLNFYSNGVSVWDKNGTVMPNGSGLFGSVSTTVSALAVPYPGNSNLHYLFTLDEATGTNGFCYSIVDMTLQSGNGDVTLKNVPIQSNVTEKMCAVKQPGTDNIWVTVHEWGTDAFYSYLVTAAGLQTTPVVSHAGMVHTIDALEQNKLGQMKFNTCGNQLALAIGYLDTVQVFDFDPATGMFSNPITIPLGDHVYGIEFSQNGSMLYTTKYNTGTGYAEIIQMDLSSGSEPVILSSMNTISNNSSGTNFYYALQLGLDGKIYSCLSWSPYLGVIADPNTYGPFCNFNALAIDLDPTFMGVSSALGLPAFVQSYFIGEVVCSFPSAIPENTSSDISIVPTISSDGFFLQGNSKDQTVSMHLFDSFGRLVSQSNSIPANGYFFGANLPAGSYLVRITDSQSVKTFRVIHL